MGMMARMWAGMQLAVTITLFLCPHAAGFAPMRPVLRQGLPLASSCPALGRPATVRWLVPPSRTTGRVRTPLQAAAEAAAEGTSDEPVKVKRLPLQDIFNKDRNYLFNVAKNIREYSWKEDEEVEEMYTDIVEEMQKGEDASVDLGQVVLVRGGDSKQVVYEVEDGQQRLITLCLLLVAIRDSSAALGDEDLRADVQVRVMTKELKEEDLPRVLPCPKDRKWFLRILQGDMGEMPTMKKDINKLPSKAEQQIIINYLYYMERLKGMDGDGLNTLRKFLLKNVNLDLNVAQTASIARKMVMGMRKGKDTEAIDVFKGLVVYSIQNETLQDTYLEKWREVESQNGRKHFTEACMLTAQAHVRKRVKRNGELDVLEAFWKQQDQTGGDAFFDDILAPAAKHLRDLDDANTVPFPNPTPQQQFQWQFLQRVMCSSQTGAKEPKLAALHALNKGAMCPDLLTVLERMTLHFVSLGGGLNVADRFNRTMALISRIDDPPGDGVPWPELSDPEKKDTLTALDQGDWGATPGKRQVALAVLLRLNSERSWDGSESKVTPGNVTVEHVLPQKPEKGSFWLVDWEDPDSKEWLHRLGNLCVLGQRGNSKGKNHDFAEKIPYLKQAGGGFPLTGEVAISTRWKQEDVKRQHMHILNLVEDIFFGPGSSA